MEGQEGRIFTLIPPIGSVLLNEQARFDQVSVCWPQRAPEENLYLSIFRGEVTSVSLTSYWNLSGQEEARREMVCIFWDLLCQIKSEINSSHRGRTKGVNTGATMPGWDLRRAVLSPYRYPTHCSQTAGTLRALTLPSAGVNMACSTLGVSPESRWDRS